jgi:hypothetical protein
MSAQHIAAAASGGREVRKKIKKELVIEKKRERERERERDV